MAFGPGLHTIHRMRTLLSVMADRPAPPLEGNVLDDEVDYFSFDVYRDFGGMEASGNDYDCLVQLGSTIEALFRYFGHSRAPYGVREAETFRRVYGNIIKVLHTLVQ
ncbi:hypothetical protein CIHG_08705 [Coccidioides immitis H538.4]|uniref:Uncharacterized protein n=3 Tax=Coccidioides immitis TaxID=5501 RepID=A0A0J8QZB5_COCIT|nr:hypothetical protein CIRG_02649 [Coccidioides immitis RMSCC 2394]KMU77400.1 hypothetical protein CISG_06647 [Coccidioides immitis RMSCC 3703]KMU90745.1 hypothetical protein CIHG_08705 [Coccidioides immitis H538.4]